MTNLSPNDAAYNREINLLDGFFEFHPEWFANLSPDDKQALESYYLLGKPVPEDIFEYRRELVAMDADLPEHARAVLARILQAGGVNLADV